MKTLLLVLGYSILCNGILNAQSVHSYKIGSKNSIFKGEDTKLELDTTLNLSHEWRIMQNNTRARKVFYTNLSSICKKSSIISNVTDNKYLINNGVKAKPPLNFFRIYSEVATGCLLGYCIVKLGLDNLEGDIGIGYVIMVGGYIVGNTVGVYIIGNIGDETGSFHATLIGSLSGMLFSYLGSIIINDSSKSPIFFFACPPLGATYMFNISRRYKSSQNKSSALINYNDDRICFAFPMMNYNLNSFYTLDLITIKF